MIFKASGAEKENEEDEISAAWLQRRALFYKQAQLTQTVIRQGTIRRVGEGGLMTSPRESNAATPETRSDLLLTASADVRTSGCDN